MSEAPKDGKFPHIPLYTLFEYVFISALRILLFQHFLATEKDGLSPHSHVKSKSV